MLSRFKFLFAVGLCSALLCPAYGQTAALKPLPVHVIRSINPADTDFRDLEFLAQEIGLARVVMLGEPTHGEGNVFEAKIRLIRYLQEKMGFTTLAFESGFYDLHKAQLELEAGKPAAEALGNSVFPIWTGTQEFQAVLPLVGPGKLRVAGFDPQLTGDYGNDLVDELRAFLKPEKGAETINFDYLDESIGFMGNHYAFPPATTLPNFENELSKVLRITARIADLPTGRRPAEKAFWQQCLRSLLAQARDYALNDPSGKTAATFEAKDSNPRDAQMADNLLWYLKQHPQEKVICWGALEHLSNRAEVLENVELRAYRPMGQAVKAALGPGQLYVLGTLSGGGTHRFSTVDLQAVPTPAAGTLEADLLAQAADWAFVSLKHDAPGRVLTTYAFEYKPLTGPWSEVVDGFLFLRAVNPPHFGSTGEAVAPAGAKAEPVMGAAPGRFGMAPRREGGTVRPAAGPGVMVQGTVLDRKTKAPVPYASVAVPKVGVGTIADGQGKFALQVPVGAALQVSSVGYATATVAAATAPLTVRLVPTATELQEVQVQGESLDPRKIMKKVLAALPANYEPNDYAAAAYTHRRISNFDTLSYEAEYVSQVFEPAGYHNFGDRTATVPQEQHRLLELHEFKGHGPRPTLFRVFLDKGQGLISADSDPVRISPLFDSKLLSKFRLRLDSVVERGGEVQYVIGFAAKRANLRTTGTTLVDRYSGQLYVQQRDHAVLRYQALWQTDTVVFNAVINKWLPKTDQLKMHANLLTDHRTDHVVTYARSSATGRYHVLHSAAQAVRAGRVIGGRAFYRQVSCEIHFTPLPVGTPPLPLNPRLHTKLEIGELPQLQYTDYHSAFWSAYQRPTAGE